MDCPIFLLHCPGYSEWRDGAASRIAAYFGREPDVVTGAEPGKPLFEEKVRDITCAPHLQGGQIGCAVGSRVMLERFLQTDAPYALLFEDDVLLRADLTAADFDATLQEIHERDPEWDWMLLFAPFSGDWNVVIPEEGEEGKRIRKCSRLSLATHAYAVSRKGAQALLEMSRNLDRPWDCYTFNGGFGRAYQGPELCYIKDGVPSVIGEIHFNPLETAS